MGDRYSPIGVMDSGVGGISVLREMRALLPGERFVFYGDTANAPYGTRPPEEVLSCVRRVTDELEARDIKALVMACNTATAVAAAALRAEKPYPIIGMEPALKPAQAQRHGGTILVLATPVTLHLPKFHALYAQYGEGAEPVPCPGLMEKVEAEDWPGAERYLRKLLLPWRKQPLDAVVLGCTHYVFLRAMLRRLLPEPTVILDGNEGTARQLRRVLADRGLLSPASEGNTQLLSSGGESSVRIMERLLSGQYDPV